MYTYYLAQSSLYTNFVYLLQLCIRLNDIEFGREELSKIPVALKFDELISRLSEVKGDQQAANTRHTLTEMLEAANDDMIFYFNELVNDIADQVRNCTHIHMYGHTYVRYTHTVHPQLSEHFSCFIRVF